MANDSKAIDKLKQIYKVYTPKQGDSSSGNSKVQPARVDAETGKVSPIKFPSEIQRMYEYFLSNYASPFVTNRERFNLYKDILFMIKNSGLMFRAMKIYKEETYEIQDGQKPVQIRAKDKKVEKVFYDWLNTIGFNGQMLSDLIENLVTFADGFWINSFDSEKGIVGVTILDPFLVKDKLEFNLATASRVQQWSQSYLNLTNKNEVMEDLIKTMADDKVLEDLSLYYQSYTLGYILKYAVSDGEDGNLKGVPPWAITHFRLFTSSSEFFPFGRPLFLNSIAVYRGFKTTEMLIDMLRVSSFPREVVTIMGDETLTPLDRTIRVNQVREMIENMSPVTNNKDIMSIGERIYTMKDLWEFDLIDPDIQMDRLGDLQHKKEDLILSTGVPDTILNPSEGAGMGGENAQGILYQNKLFQRNVENIKSAIMEGISQTFRTHLAITNQFDGETTEFELLMPVNADVYTSEKIDSINDSFELATNIMNNLAQMLGMDRGESLPKEVVLDIIQNFVNIDPHQLNKWIDKINQKAEESTGGEGGEGSSEATPFIVPTDFGGGSGKNKKKESVNPKCVRLLENYKKGDDTLLREAYFKTKEESNMTYGILGKYQFFNESKKLKEDKTKPMYEKSYYGLVRSNIIKMEKKRLHEERNRGT